MARTARTHRLTALAVRKHANDPRMTAPLHDGSGLYLRKRGASLTWVLRLTDPANGSQQWRRRAIKARQTAASSRRAALERRVTGRALLERWAAIDLAPRLTADGRRLGR